MGPAGLCPGGRKLGVCMRDTADVWEVLVKFDVRWQVGGGTKFTFDDAPVQVRNDDILGSHGLIRHAAWFDSDQPISARYAARVAERVKYKPAAHQLQIGIENFFSQTLQQHDDPVRLVLNANQRLHRAQTFDRSMVNGFPLAR